MYKKNDIVFSTGFILLLIDLFFKFFLKPLDIDEPIKQVFGIISLLIRIAVTIWIVIIAKTKNRKEFAWGVFAFIMPSIALIAIAFQKTLLPKNI